MDAASALRQGLYLCLTGDPDVTSLLGGPRIYDDVPRGIDPPYAVIGEGTVKDWSTSLDRGHEHFVFLSVWSKEGGARQACLVGETIRGSLEAMSLPLDGHRLVNLAVSAMDIKREANAKLLRAILRLRAVTEVI